jgi:6-phosphogluconate dehydrogenase
MIPAGAGVDQELSALEGALEAGDVVIDAGNSHYRDTIRREKRLGERGIHFLGLGVSGGEEGARNGPSMMAGGPEPAWRRARPLLEAMAARAGGSPCVAHLGPDGAGHFVKMVHNGIEYAVMQVIAEVYGILKGLLGLDAEALAERFTAWNDGNRESYLLEITGRIFRERDVDSGKPLVDLILDSAEQKGTGAWTGIAALELGVAAPTIIAAAQARSQSALKDARERLAQITSLSRPAFKGDAERLISQLGEALLAGMAISYAQGFAVMRAANDPQGWTLDLATVARIWRAGCIIRGTLLEPIAAAYDEVPGLDDPLFDPPLNRLIAERSAALRSVAATATEHGLWVPALASAAAWLEGATTARLPVNLTQAQRDLFGAHQFERIDRPGRFHHEWQQ